MENSAYQNSDNSIYRFNLLTDSKCSMHWSNNCSNSFTSSTIESTFDCPDYNSYNDRLFPSGYSKDISTLDKMCDKYHEPVSTHYSKYSPLTSSNQMQIWTDIDQTQSSEANSWGIMFPMKVTSDSDSKWSWDCDRVGNNVRNDLCGTKQLSGNYYPCVSPKSSLSLHNLEHTLSSLNIGENRCENVPSPSKKTWALIVGRQGKTPPGAYKTYTRDVIVPESAPNITSTPVDVSLKKARFFVIKSYSEDDVYRSIKYQIWCSTENGNRKLDSAYRQSSSEMTIFLFFSVNGSGHFCGVAEMVGPVDYKTRAGVWAQGKWKGQFAVKWILVKDVPNSQLRHIRIETNENKPVTNSRDVTEIPLERGRQVLKIVSAFKATSSIYDDFDHYEQREISESIS